jgi:hypothetical protein
MLLDCHTGYDPDMTTSDKHHILFPSVWIVLTLFVFLITISFSLQAADDSPGGLVENKGQWPQQVLYATDIPGGRLYVERSRLVYSFYETNHHHGKNAAENRHVSSNTFTEGHAFEVKFLNANAGVSVSAGETSSTIFNYIIGNDPSKWVQGARAFGLVELTNIYPGVNLKLYKTGSSLKYDFVVTPQGDVADIALEYSGADTVATANENINIKTRFGELTEMKPYAFQDKYGKRKQVQCKFRLHGNKVTFDVLSSWDKSVALVIDPLIVFSAYSGSTADNWGNTATFDDEGNLYSAGIVASIGYPVTTGAYHTTFNGGSWDVGILKFDSAGRRLIYATYLGGLSSETPQSLLVNNAGELLILGTTSSPNFPATNGSHFSGGRGFEPMDGVPYANGSDLFIAKLSADGKRLLGSTFIGGNSNDGVNFISGQFNSMQMVQSPLCKNYGDQFRGDIVVDDEDNVYVASNTTSSDFPFQRNTFNGGSHDAILIKLTADLSTPLWSRYLGGAGTDAAYSLKLDTLSHIFIAGGTNSTDFSGINGYKKTKGNDIDGWVAEVTPDGEQIVNATYVGTSAYDQAYFIELNPAQEVYLYGQTQGSYPVSAGVFSQSGGGQFIHKLSHDLQSSAFSTVFGSGGNSPNISPTAFLVSDCNKIYLAGWGGLLNTPTIRIGNGPSSYVVTRNFIGGSTAGLKVSSDAYQRTTSGNDFYLMVLDADASAFLYGTFLGGAESVTHVDGGTSRFDKRGVVYHAVCAGCGGFSDFPAVNTPAGHNRNRARNGAGCNNAAFKFDLATLRASLQTNTLNFDMPGIDTLCYPSTIVFQNLSAGAKYFVWDLGDGTSLTKNDTSHVSHTYEPGVYLVTLTAYNNETCEGEDIASVIVSVFDPDIEVVDDGVICAGSSYQLFASGGKYYQWTSDDGWSSAISNPTVAPEDTTMYHITIRDEVGCEVKDSVLVSVLAAPDYQMEVTKKYDCWNRPAVRFMYTSNDAYNYLWHLGDGDTNTSTDFIHHYENDGQYEAALEASNEHCFYREEIPVTVITIRVPNVITINEDGMNDSFVIEASDPIKLELYNRWGELVFKDDDYQNNWTASSLSAGIYYYNIYVENQTTCKGWIHVVK